MNHTCPRCHRPIYDRHFTTCGYCDTPIPQDRQYAPDQIAELDQTLAELEAQRIAAEQKPHVIAALALDLPISD